MSKCNQTFIRLYSKRLAELFKKYTGFHITHAITGFDDNGKKVAKESYSFDKRVLTAM